ncbi:MAG: hypothetical protein SF097_04580 [Acidobacteriota bacterium]|nr:hypothetical protein [Acidobacteriota bacterium]
MSRLQTKKFAALEIQFRRTGERRYAVTIHRSGQPTLEMNPAPGYDSAMPHDLLHFIVESELGLRQGIFGQIADGGTAGTFRAVQSPGEDRREAARSRRRETQRGSKLLRQGQEDSMQSERATVICLYEWLAQSADTARRTLAAEMAVNARHIRSQLTAAESKALNESAIKRICAQMEELSQQWAALKIDQALTVFWPGKIR